MQDLNISETLAEFECHVEGLIHSVLETRVNEIPVHFQRYTFDMPNRISQLLCKVAHVIVCYHHHR